jgi:hypothetical protein
VSEEREPLRLRDDPREAEGLRAMLTAAGGETSDPAMLDRVLGNVLAGGGGGGESSGGGGGGSASGLKIVAALGAGVLGAGVLAWMIRDVPEGPFVPAPPSTIEIIDASAAPDAYAEIDAGVLVDVGLDAFVVLTRADRRASPPPVSESVPESDLALLLRATREHDAAASLALALEHRTLFPDSASAEDHEALIVLDLARLNRASQANASADVFRARWPRSAHQAHIDAALARMIPP